MKFANAAAPVENRSTAALDMNTYMNLCASSSAFTIPDLQRDFARAAAAGADLVEIRLDLLEPGERAKLRSETRWLRDHRERMVLTFRAPGQGGAGEGNAAARLRTLVDIAE